MEQVRFGILCAGTIAHEMARTISAMNNKGEGVCTAAVAARDLGRAQAFAEQYGIPRAYGSYEELYRDPDIDAIYVASPHSHHYEHARECLLHGKHVLCEKAFTLNASQAEELTKLAKEKGLFLMEAIWTRFMPFVEKLREVLASGVVGEVKQLEIGFGVNHPEVERLFKPELAGGALLDVGIYTLTFAALVFGTQVTDIRTTALLTELGVDGCNSMTLTFAGERMAVLYSSVLATLRNQAVLYGNKGRIELDKFWQAESIRVLVDGTEPVEYALPFEFTGYEYEVRAMLADLKAGRLENEVMPHAETIRMMRLMDSIRREWGLVYPMER